MNPSQNETSRKYQIKWNSQMEDCVTPHVYFQTPTLLKRKILLSFGAF